MYGLPGQAIEQWQRNLETALEFFPEQPFMGEVAGEHEAVQWAAVWAVENGPETVGESYVNLVPTAYWYDHKVAASPAN